MTTTARASAAPPGGAKWLGPGLLLGAGAVLGIAILLPWGKAHALDHSVDLSAIELPVVGWWSGVTALLYLAVGGLGMARRGRVLAGFALFGALASLVFAVTLLSITSILLDWAEAWLGSEVAAAEPGIGPWLLLLTSLLAMAGSCLVMLAGPGPSDHRTPDRSGGGRASATGKRPWAGSVSRMARNTAQLPAVIARATRDHYRSERHGDDPGGWG